ncbi:MAG: hypothetical protein Q9218_005853 [Villophora microphyllina]
MGEPRNTTRPRLSLNCFTCRRRKVRCTKERPSCNSCLRTKDVCVYDEDAWETAKSQAKNKQAGRKSTSKSQSKNRGSSTQDENWVNWTTKPFEPGSSRESPLDVTAEHSSCSESSLKLAKKSTSRTHPDSNDGTQGNIDASNLPTSAADDMFFPSLNNLYSDFPTPPSWGNSHTVDLMDTADLFHGQVPLLSPEMNHESDHQHPRTLKRPHTPNESSTQRVRSSVVELPITISEKVTAAPNTPTKLEEDRQITGIGTQDPPTAGLVSVRRGARVRYANPAFWAYVKGYESFSEAFLDGVEDPAKVSSQPHIDSSTLANLLSLLPARQVCNTLLYSFLVGVQPLYSFVHVSTLRSDYNDFWQWYENIETAFPTGKLMDDPTFLCLLFSVLYCGSVTASNSFWAVGALQAVEKEAIVKDLGQLLDSSLKCVQHLRHPTINTLTASLLSHSFVAQEGDSADLDFVSVMIRTAQRMGLHLQAPMPKLDAVACEVRRQVWCHILWLDLQTSVIHGLPMHCFSNDAQYSAPPSGERSAKTRSDRATTGLATPSVEEHSASMLLATGVSETSRFERLLVHHFHTGDVAQARNIQSITGALKRLQASIDGMIASLPAQGIPEKGLIPSRMANASPLSSRNLYADHMQEPTVLTSLARVMLNMLKTEAAIMLQKTLLDVGSPNSSELDARWNRIVELCTTYLRNFLQMIQIPAFSPYSWFCSIHFGPLQSAFLILAYLQQKRDADTEAQALFLIDEVLDFFEDIGQDNRPTVDQRSESKQESRNLSTSRRASVAWQNLKAMRVQLSSPLKQHQGQTQTQKQRPKTQIRTASSSVSSSHEATPSSKSFEPATPNSLSTPGLTRSGQSPWSSARSLLLPSGLAAASQPDNHGKDDDHFMDTILDTSVFDGSISTVENVWPYQGLGMGRGNRDLSSVVTKAPASAGAAMEGAADYFDKSIRSQTRRTSPTRQDRVQSRDFPVLDAARMSGRSRSTDGEGMSPFTGDGMYNDSSDNFSGMMLNGEFWTDM